MKIAIHNQQSGFVPRWIRYCEIKGLDYVLVNCYDNNIIQFLIEERITHVMWHLNHSHNNDIQYGILIMNGIDAAGIKTYPNYSTRWHFDNKIAQKYLLESINAPLIKSYVYYDKNEAINFLNTATFPKVAKLKRGAGSTNVQLINNYQEGVDFIDKLFGSGVLSTHKAFDNFNQKLKVAKQIKNPLKLYKKFINFLRKNKKERLLSAPEKGYVYFQDFLSGNDYDTRIIVIGDKAFGIRRFNRENDFRASGSGLIDYQVSNINLEFVKIAFEITRKLNAQCLAFDFVYDGVEPRIIEICFGFSTKAYDRCQGYWDLNLNFFSERFCPQDFMIENFIR